MIRYEEKPGGWYSYGCESCVKPIREDVRKLREAFKASQRRKGFKCEQADTGLKRTG